MDDAELSRELPNLLARLVADDVMVRGADELAVDAGCAGEGVRPMIGGVETLGVDGADGLGVEGFDHDSKKSSSVCSLGVEVAAFSTPSTTIPFGNLLLSE